MIKSPYLLFLGDAADGLAAKVAQGIKDCVFSKSIRPKIMFPSSPAQLINLPPNIRHYGKDRQPHGRQFALNIFVELREEAVTVAMPALANCIFQSRY